MKTCKSWFKQLVGYKLGHFKYAFRELRKHFVSVCPDNECKKINRVLWFDVGNHDNCIPF